MMLTGRDVDADEAERIGLVSRTVPEEDLLDGAFERACAYTGSARLVALVRLARRLAPHEASTEHIWRAAIS